jgi:hypothetical protein
LSGSGALASEAGSRRVCQWPHLRRRGVSNRSARGRGTSEYRFEETVAAYLKRGVFYVKIQSSVPQFTADIAGRVNRPESIDVVFSGLVFTGPGGHPIALHEQLLSRGAYPGFTNETLNGGSYFAVASLADVEAAWPKLLEGGPGFVKLFLLESEAHTERVGKPEFKSRTGLDPTLVRPIVERAHAAGLRVSAHVDSAADMRVALEAGVDEIAHLPGRRSPERVDDALAREAAQRKAILITTAALARRREADADLYARIRAAQGESLRALQAAGARIALGSDDTRGSVIDEAEYVAGLGVLSNAEVLLALTTGCAETVFPECARRSLAEEEAM